MRTKIVFLLFLAIVVTMTVSCKKKSDNSSNTSTTVTDIDGNIYHTVLIGTQTWIVGNLKVTHYRNGDAVQYVADSSSWINLVSGAYCDYGNFTRNGVDYGHLYNWYVIADTRNICPAGWHVPTDDEWSLLILYLGGENVAGGKMKEKGTAHWAITDTSVNNSSGFTALPGGFRTYLAQFDASIGHFGYWWSSTGDGFTSPIRVLGAGTNDVLRLLSAANYGCSIRCVKD
jgi:uncharacterized protein (TIGR02145 family)